MSAWHVQGSGAHDWGSPRTRPGGGRGVAAKAGRGRWPHISTDEGAKEELSSWPASSSSGGFRKSRGKGHEAFATAGRGRARITMGASSEESIPGSRPPQPWDSCPHTVGPEVLVEIIRHLHQENRAPTEDNILACLKERTARHWTSNELQQLCEQPVYYKPCLADKPKRERLNVSGLEQEPSKLSRHGAVSQPKTYQQPLQYPQDHQHCLNDDHQRGQQQCLAVEPYRQPPRQPGPQQEPPALLQHGQQQCLAVEPYRQPPRLPAPQREPSALLQHGLASQPKLHQQPAQYPTDHQRCLSNDYQRGQRQWQQPWLPRPADGLTTSSSWTMRQLVLEPQEEEEQLVKVMGHRSSTYQQHQGFSARQVPDPGDLQRTGRGGGIGQMVQEDWQWHFPTPAVQERMMHPTPQLGSYPPLLQWSEQEFQQHVQLQQLQLQVQFVQNQQPFDSQGLTAVPCEYTMTQYSV